MAYILKKEINPREFAVQAGNNLSDGLGCTSRGWDDVGGSTTSTTPILRGWSINSLLGSGGSMNGGHETFNNSEFVVNNFCKGSQAVLHHMMSTYIKQRQCLSNLTHSCARGVGDDSVFGVIGIQVDTTNEHGRICGRSGNDYLLGTALQVCGGFLNGGEYTL